MSNLTLSAFADEIDNNLTAQMDVLDSHNIKYIEIRGVYGKNISEHTLQEVSDIKQQLDKRGFKISAIGSPIGKIQITDDFTAHFKLFQHITEMAKILQTNYIRIFSFYMPEGSTPGLYRDEIISRLEEMTTYAASRGITLLHENEKDIYGDIPERCLDILETVNSKFLKATFDPANFIQCGVQPYPDAYSLLKKHIEYIHIKDALFRDASVVPAGYGDGRIKDLLMNLNDDNYSGFLSLEPHLASFTGLQNLEFRSKIPVKAESNGETRFAIAVDALNKLLKEIDAQA
ncbi:MAG: xylose isomerase [Eubacterium sp.]|jgi:sugar phosphate isomerase/epimerase|nr:xylose isomerase [Eubacterium sp.]